MTVKMSISVSDSQAEYARKQVEAGRYASTSAVFQSAIEAQRREDEAYEAELRAFRDMIEERRKGPYVSLERFREMTEEMLARKRDQYGLAD